MLIQSSDVTGQKGPGLWVWPGTQHMVRICASLFPLSSSSSSLSLALTLPSPSSLLLHLCKCWTHTESCTLQLSSHQSLDSDDPSALYEICNQLQLKSIWIHQYKLLSFTATEQWQAQPASFLITRSSWLKRGTVLKYSTATVCHI